VRGRKILKESRYFYMRKRAHKFLSGINSIDKSL